MLENIKSLVKLSELINYELPWIEIWALMQMEYIGYAKMNWGKIFYDNSDDFSFLENSGDDKGFLNSCLGLCYFHLVIQG